MDLKISFLLLLVLAVFITPLTTLSNNQNQKLGLHLKSPRETVKTFRKYMDEVSLGDYKNLFYAFKCTEPDINIKNYKYDTKDLNVSLKLYYTLKQLNYRLIDFPDKVKEGDKVSVKLNYKNKPVFLHFIKITNGNWLFSKETLDSPEIKEISEDRLKVISSLFLTNRKDLTYNPNLKSAADTFITFMNGVEGNYGFTIKDSIDAMDLSNYLPIVRNALGKFAAIMIYRILKAENIDVSQLNADPSVIPPQILFIEPGIGSIVINDIINKENNSVSWKFTKHTIQNLLNVYRNYQLNMNKIPITGLNNFTFYIAIDDWIHDNYPTLTKSFIGMALWKWCAIIPVLLIAFLIYKISKLILIPIKIFLERHIFRENNRSTVYYCILPVRLILVIAWFWSILEFLGNDYTFWLTIYILGILTDILTIWSILVILWILSELIVRKINATVKTRVGKAILVTDIISKILQIIVVISGIYHIAVQFGFDSTQILTVFGIGSIAIALAGKDTIENFFGTVMITIEGPIRPQDWIIVDDFEGTVEKIGLRSTRIRTFKDSVITVPNAKFITTPVNNMGMRGYRRYDTKIGIEYNTPTSLIRDFIEGICKIIRTSEYTRKDYYIIRMNEFGEHASEILVYMFFKTPDWEMELEAREDFIFKILEYAEELGVKIAIPSSEIHLKR
jgi:MscS family membrane protein